jgi:hypothetical protein
VLNSAPARRIPAEVCTKQATTHDGHMPNKAAAGGNSKLRIIVFSRLFVFILDVRSETNANLAVLRRAEYSLPHTFSHTTQ